MKKLFFLIFLLALLSCATDKSPLAPAAPSTTPDPDLVEVEVVPDDTLIFRLSDDTTSLQPVIQLKVNGRLIAADSCYYKSSNKLVAAVARGVVYPTIAGQTTISIQYFKKVAGHQGFGGLSGMKAYTGRCLVSVIL